MKVEDMDLDMVPYKELLHEEAAICAWAKEKGSFFDLDMSVFA